MDESWLNTEHINRSGEGIEYHPLIPFLPENARVLFLGSFPPQRKRWCMDFYYPNFINDHWRIEGQIFFGDKNHFVDTEHKRFKIDDIVAFCQEKGLAFYDTSTAIRRLQDNASDKFLEVVKPTVLPGLLARIPACRAVVTTGQKAADVIVGAFGCDEPRVGGHTCLDIHGRSLEFWRMPSTSRAYPLPLERKADAYRQLFSALGIK